MKRFLFFVAAACLCAVLSAETVYYTADDATVIHNPERGFIRMWDGHVTKKAPHVVKGSESEIDKYVAQDNLSIILVHYYLDELKSTETLPAEVLQGFDEDMDVLRSKGLKAILRFSYIDSTYVMDDGKKSAHDAPLDLVEKHIAQYKSHWQANADVIFCFQAGIIGAWGEWHYTDNFGNRVSEINEPRRALIDTLLKAVPRDRYIQLRTPIFKTGYVGSTKPLTAEEAYNYDLPKARLGHHNDAFLYDYDNMGTYKDTAKQKPYIAQETLYVPIGGETDIEDEDKAKEWAAHDATVAEMSRLHWTFIQSGYSTVVTDMWRANGTFAELNRNLGYRFQLVQGTYSNEVEQGSKLSVNMQIKNVGYAPLYNERPAYIVLRAQTAPFTEYKIQMEGDPRTWLPNGVLSTVNEQLPIPEDMPEGTYNLYLYLPDKYESLADDPAYAVRFANGNDVWESTTGMNNLKVSVTITTKKETPDPPTPPTPPDPPAPGEPIVLPATLDKTNVSAYSDDMTMYNTDYFDFGPEDAENLDRWTEWKVELRYPGKYIVSEIMKSVMAEWGMIGHSWQLSLLPEMGAAVSTYTTEAKWEEGELSYDVKWDLSGVQPDTYTLRVMNATEWAQPKLKSLTLQYDGEIPTDTNEPIVKDQIVNGFDVLGRPVDTNYRGIVITRGKKRIRLSVK